MDFNFNELFNKIKAIDEGLSQGNIGVQAIGAAPSHPMETSECAECGGGDMTPRPTYSQEQSDSITMNVSMSGSGKGGIRDLINVLANIEAQDNHGSHGNGHNGDEIVVGTPKTIDIEKPMIDSYANEPDETTYGIDSVISKGNDLHSKGIERPKQAGGGNPWNMGESAMKAKLSRHYAEVKNRGGSLKEGYHGWDEPEDSGVPYYGNGIKTAEEIKMPAPYDMKTDNPHVIIKKGEPVECYVKAKMNGDDFEYLEIICGNEDGDMAEVDPNRADGFWIDKLSERCEFEQAYTSDDDYDGDGDGGGSSYRGLTDYEKRINRDY